MLDMYVYLAVRNLELMPFYHNSVTYRAFSYQSSLFVDNEIFIWSDELEPSEEILSSLFICIRNTH